MVIAFKALATVNAADDLVAYGCSATSTIYCAGRKFVLALCACLKKIGFTPLMRATRNALRVRTLRWDSVDVWAPLTVHSSSGTFSGPEGKDNATGSQSTLTFGWTLYVRIYWLKFGALDTLNDAQIMNQSKFSQRPSDWTVAACVPGY
jgi:hypothetical protein